MAKAPDMLGDLQKELEGGNGLEEGSKETSKKEASLFQIFSENQPRRS